MITSDIAILLAYFITFTCYGTWLHGEKITSVDRIHNIPETAYCSFNFARQISVKKRMVESPYLLGDIQRGIVLTAIQEVCAYRAWDLLAAHVRTNHVHVVIHALASSDSILNAIKSYASRALNATKLDHPRIKRWTRHGSTQYLWSEEEIEATIQYVVYEQGNPMAVFENKNR